MSSICVHIVYIKVTDQCRPSGWISIAAFSACQLSLTVTVKQEKASMEEPLLSAPSSTEKLLHGVGGKEEEESLALAVRETKQQSMFHCLYFLVLHLNNSLYPSCARTEETNQRLIFSGQAGINTGVQRHTPFINPSILPPLPSAAQ